MLKKEAAEKNVLACMELGKLYERGLPETGKDAEKSQAYYKQAFEGLSQLNNRLVAFEEWEKRRKSAYECLRGILQPLSDDRQNQETFSSLRKFKTKSAERRKIDARKNEKDGEEFLPK